MAGYNQTPLHAPVSPITPGGVTWHSVIDRRYDIASEYTASCMRTSLNGTVLLTRTNIHTNTPIPYVTADVEKFEGPSYRSRATYINTRKGDPAVFQHIAAVIGVEVMTSISPNGQYCGVNNIVSAFKWGHRRQDWDLDNKVIGPVPDTIAALSNDTVWVYRQQDNLLALAAYTLTGLNEQPAQTIPLTLPPTKPPLVCCRPSTGELVMVRDDEMWIALPGTGTAQLLPKLTYTTDIYGKKVWSNVSGNNCDSVICFLTCRNRHIFIMDVAFNLHVHSWDGGQEIRKISASRLGLRTGQRVLCIGYSDEFEEPILRLLTSDNKYIILKVNDG